MTRAEIEEQIEQTIEASKSIDTVGEYHNKTNLIKSLTDLFLQLSEELCREMRANCAESYLNAIATNESVKLPFILNAPLPSLG